MTNDLSANTILISTVVGLCAYFLKAGVSFLASKIGLLIEALWKNQASMVLLDAKIKEVIDIVNDVPKVKSDLNVYYKRLRFIETKLNIEEQNNKM